MIHRVRRTATVIVALLALGMFASATPAQAAGPGMTAVAAEVPCNPAGPGVPVPPGQQNPADVRLWQCYLNWALTIGLTDPLREDGNLGTETRARIALFQRCAGIGVDGQVGPITLLLLRQWAVTSYTTGARIC
ncbi:peptidoglycan-binding domain-containing protein [Catenuloplanes japonicus]|uniref:peptidoglycan-binding domain-containing protein n=1 Tax=Catenuloplanes japonicus TaxID=33876 RepID=UPI0005253AB1|nr:peptidoglycan-binding domain-containing protein [Catenuloplanes japonicus]